MIPNENKKAIFTFSINERPILGKIGTRDYSRLSSKNTLGFLDFPIAFTEMHKFGVCHGDDLYYNFDFSSDQCAKFSEQDFQVAYNMASFFTNFARTGDPNNKDSLVN